MNELPSSSQSDPQPATSMKDPVAPDSSQAIGQRSNLPAVDRTLYVAVAALAILLLAQWWYSHTQISNLRTEVATRLQSGDAANTETKVLVKSAQDSLRDLQSKISVLENKQSEAQNQQVALEQLYQDLSKNRDDWALAEIEQVLSTASQQLQLAGNVQGALIALQNADNRLSRSDKSQFIAIRRSIARDLDKLKVLPSVDVPGIALRLDSVIAQIDGMPLLADEKPVTPAMPPKHARRVGSKVAANGPKASRNKESTASDWWADVQDKWQSWTAEMWTEVQQLIRVRSVDSPEALLLSPTQAYYVRENLKLRLMNARLALLSRDEPAFRSDLMAAQDAITRYFDTRARQTQVVQAILKQVQGSNLAIQMPTLSDSLNAVRNYKARP